MNISAFSTHNLHRFLERTSPAIENSLPHGTLDAGTPKYFLTTSERIGKHFSFSDHHLKGSPSICNWSSYWYSFISASNLSLFLPFATLGTFGSRYALPYIMIHPLAFLSRGAASSSSSSSFLFHLPDEAASRLNVISVSISSFIFLAKVFTVSIASVCCSSVRWLWFLCLQWNKIYEYILKIYILTYSHLKVFKIIKTDLYLGSMKAHTCITCWRVLSLISNSHFSLILCFRAEVYLSGDGFTSSFKWLSIRFHRDG